MVKKINLKINIFNLYRYNIESYKNENENCLPDAVQSVSNRLTSEKQLVTKKHNICFRDPRVKPGDDTEERERCCAMDIPPPSTQRGEMTPLLVIPGLDPGISCKNTELSIY